MITILAKVLLGLGGIVAAWFVYVGFTMSTLEPELQRLSEKELDSMQWDIRTMIVVVILALGFLSMGGCAYTRVELEHVSHPFAGPPFGPPNQEDSLNQINYCKGTNNGTWYVENCLGYKFMQGGFYGPDLTYTGRIGLQWGQRN